MTSKQLLAVHELLTFVELWSRNSGLFTDIIQIRDDHSQPFGQIDWLEAGTEQEYTFNQRETF